MAHCKQEGMMGWEDNPT